MPQENILITVKTYPTLSSKYGELVCTAGLREDGSWIRIYPIPFRSLEEYKKFEKYRIITANVVRNKKDIRPESHKIDLTSLDLSETILSTKNCWRDRRKWVIDKSTVYTDLDALIDKANRENVLSLATFKPAKILKFHIEEESEREWDSEKVAKIEEASKQDELFAEFQPEKLTKLVDKLPYKFSYEFEDDKGKQAKLMIEDWEIGALFWNCLKQHGSEDVACKKVQEKYFDHFTKKDLYLFLGTTRKWHGVGKNPFVIVGLFTPDFQNQLELELPL